MKPFDKHPDLIVRQEKPFNGGPPLELLRQAFVTPTDLFFVRNHGSVPDIDPDGYRLSVTGMVNRPINLSLDEIRNHFPKSTYVTTLQCAGNRRDDLIAIAPLPGEVAWGAEAISNARWGGVALREVLLAVGVEEGARHVAFTGLDEVEKEGRRFGFGGSIPIEKAMSPEVLLAYEMNGELLAPVHGFPLRVVVPGYIGARSVKWLASITLQTDPSANYFQAHSYKLFPPQVRAETANWDRGLMLGELSVNAVICQPLEGETIPASPTLVQGYAIAGGGRPIERVDLSIDEGETWVMADLLEDDHPWTWRFWEANLELKPGPYQIIARAWDSAANTQPEEVKNIWNFKGYMNNAWHRVRLNVWHNS
ncbi:MAG: molybdopterin-dependent oxidoreductase [Candidatus Bipolaricaulia bacterium]